LCFVQQLLEASQSESILSSFHPADLARVAAWLPVPDDFLDLHELLRRLREVTEVLVCVAHHRFRDSLAARHPTEELYLLLLLDAIHDFLPHLLDVGKVVKCQVHFLIKMTAVRACLLDKSRCRVLVNRLQRAFVVVEEILRQILLFKCRIVRVPAIAQL